MNSSNKKVLDLSLIIPIYSSEASIPMLLDELEKLKIKGNWEVIFIDDGSPDNSFKILMHLLKNSKLNSILIRHNRNYGEHQAVLTGYRFSKGSYVINLDDDLQNPPEEALKLYSWAYKNNLDLVYGEYEEDEHSNWRNVGSKFAHITAHLFLDLPRSSGISSFRCLKGSIAKEVAKYSGPYPYIDGLIGQVSQSVESIKVKHDKRYIGSSGYNLRRLIRLWINILTSFSLMPLRLSSILGVVFALTGLVGLLFVIYETLLKGVTVSGWPSVISAVLLFGGIQCLLLGLVGEYLGRIYLTVSGKPQSTIRSIDKYKN